MISATSRSARRPSTGTVRLLLLPSIVGVAGLLLTLKVPQAAAPGANLLFQWAMYAGWGWWALASARALGVPCGDLLACPADVRSWRLLWVVLPLLALSIAGLIVQSALFVTLFAAARGALTTATIDTPRSIVWSILLVLTGATLVPLVEEIVFRGVLLRAWTVRFGARRAAIGTAIAFGVLHHDVIGAFAFGIAMVVLYRRSGTLLLPVITHAAYNVLTGISILLPGGGDVFAPAELRGAVSPALLVMAASLLCLAVALRPLPRLRVPAAHPA
jgi:membrane protease YdiL (CAAX protease family)